MAVFVDGTELASGAYDLTIAWQAATESEPNDTVGNATPYVAGLVAALPDGDADLVALTLPPEQSEITAATADLGNGACDAGAIDTMLELLASDGTTVLAANDDGAAFPNFCSSVAVTGLASGTYYLRVTASPFAPTGYATGYRLLVTTQ